MVRRSIYGGDAAFVALLAATSLVGIQSYSMSSLFGTKAPGLRSSAFCQGPICKSPELVPSLRTRGKHGERAEPRMCCGVLRLVCCAHSLNTFALRSMREPMLGCVCPGRCLHALDRADA